MLAIDKVWNEDLWEDLSAAFSMGCNEDEACLYAKIPRAVYDSYIEKDEQMAKKFATLKKNTTLLAKKNVYNDLVGGDVNTSKYILDRLSKNEGYSTRNEVTGADGSKLFNLSEDEQERISRAMGRGTADNKE